jgi:hypothetical protein
MAVVDYGSVTVHIYDDKLRKFLNTPHSGDSRDLWKSMERAKNAALRGARNQVGVKSGALRKSIRATHLGNATGQYVTIGSNKSYALAHHEGTKPHMIAPRIPGGTLIFSKGSRVIMTSMVRHPGTKPNKYLSNQIFHFARVFSF